MKKLLSILLLASTLLSTYAAAQSYDVYASNQTNEPMTLSMAPKSRTPFTLAVKTLPAHSGVIKIGHGDTANPPDPIYRYLISIQILVQLQNKAATSPANVMYLMNYGTPPYIHVGPNQIKNTSGKTYDVSASVSDELNANISINDDYK